MPQSPSSQKQRPSLKEDVLRLDRELLHLLLRRFNLLTRMRGNRSHLLASEEKELREAWTKEAMRISSDPKLSTELFQLLENITFHPKPAESKGEQKLKRPGFNLAPSLKQANIRMHMPASGWHVHAWLLLAACLGRDMQFDHVLMNDHQLDLTRALADAGISAQTRDDSLFLRPDKPFTCPDLSIHCGNDPSLFGLFVGQYIVRPSRVRFTAESQLALSDLSGIAHFLPTVGARMSSSRSGALRFPIRIECSGVLPKTILVPDTVPASFVKGLILALPFAEDPVSIDCSEHSEGSLIIGQCLPLLEEAGFQAAENKKCCLSVNPSHPSLFTPTIPCDPVVCANILAIPLLTGGSIQASGLKPKDPKFSNVLAYLSDLGLSLTWKDHPQKLTAQGSTRPGRLECTAPATLLSGPYSPLIAALHVAFALKGTPLPGESPNDTTAQTFFELFGLTRDTDGLLQAPQEIPDVQWIAPTPEWAMAFALTAFARKKEGFKLGNSGIITEIWPKFWALYNALPLVHFEQTTTETHAEQKKRRRIVTDAQAKIPPQTDA